MIVLIPSNLRFFSLRPPPVPFFHTPRFFSETCEPPCIPVHMSEKMATMMLKSLRCYTSGIRKNVRLIETVAPKANHDFTLCFLGTISAGPTRSRGATSMVVSLRSPQKRHTHFPSLFTHWLVDFKVAVLASLKSLFLTFDVKT
jgi:hypothetical protein